MITSKRGGSRERVKEIVAIVAEESERGWYLLLSWGEETDGPASTTLQLRALASTAAAIAAAMSLTTTISSPSAFRYAREFRQFPAHSFSEQLRLGLGQFPAQPFSFTRCDFEAFVLVAVRIKSLGPICNYSCSYMLATLVQMEATVLLEELIENCVREYLGNPT